MNSVLWHSPQVCIVETGAPVSSTLFPAASSSAKFGWRGAVCSMGVGCGCASAERTPKEAVIARSNPRVMRNLCFVIGYSFVLSSVQSKQTLIERFDCGQNCTALRSARCSFPSAPFDGIAGITKRFPIQSSACAVTGFTLECILRGLNHVGCRPVHISFRKAILTAVHQTGHRSSHLKGAVPIKGCPEAIFAGSDRLEQVVIHHIEGLLRNVQLEWEDFCIGIVDVPSRFINVSDSIRVDFVAEQVAIFVVPVEPEISRREILVVHE